MRRHLRPLLLPQSGRVRLQYAQRRQTRASIMQTRTRRRDLLSPKDTVSLYLCMQTNEVQTLKPLSRLLINTMLQKLIRDMKFDTSGGASMKQRLLLLLDEFPQLGNLKAMELALALCAGYGIKVCIVAQDVNQLNKEYTKDNSIASATSTSISPRTSGGGAGHLQEPRQAHHQDR